MQDEIEFQNSDPSTPTPPVEVPAEALDEEVLIAVIDSFILREGTDYGVRESSMESKRRQVHEQILSGKVKIFFDPDSQSVNLVSSY